MAAHILIVDDEKEIADLISLYLRQEGYIVTTLYSSFEVLPYLSANSVDLAILDVMMPDMDGLMLSQKIRESYYFPIIFVSARIEETDRILGLNMGADDYITKPFKPLELLARVRSNLRRYKDYLPLIEEQIVSEENILTFKDLKLNLMAHSLYQGERVIDLTPTEFKLLEILMKQPGKPMSAEELFYNIWGENYYDKANNTITVHIRHLRSKLQDGVTESYIKTIWGIGYALA